MSVTSREPDRVVDIIGIGIGPFNLGLAALLDKVPEIDALFFEKKEAFDWHPGMLIEGTTLQVPFLADLVSMADVTSKYSFLHYLQRHNRLYHYYFLEKFKVPRQEYNHYCRWTAEQLASCRFGKEVIKVTPIEAGGEALYEVHVRDMRTQSTSSFVSRHLVLGIGTSPAVPEGLQSKIGDTLFHSSQYLSQKNRALQAKSITVIGSGQSAAEIFYDLAKEQADHNFELSWFTRSKGFFPMEYSKLGLEYFSPDYIDFFYSLSQSKKDALLPQQDLLYKGISAETIGEIYDLLYHRSIANETPAIRLQSMTEVGDIDRRTDGWTLRCTQWVKEEMFDHDSEIVILGTGYTPTVPSFLSDIAHLIEWDEKGRYRVTRDYKMKRRIDTPSEIFVQNGELHTHGVGAPDLGLGAYRNAVIINTLAGREVYPIHQRNVFQTFGLAKECALINA
ncbi:lysine N(6)-hydroxylase/L-ornithine N(5)-oxygenase family protein [Aneurinibacillus sp. REN35]|uniref:lysine N(6)-hydroxylase/L-ornithine N(5)-oxygenase family protein n=1 Tax=Aneurinibacillus sp. REN35 TaxID=3237286 RepID=UPI003529B53F